MAVIKHGRQSSSRIVPAIPRALGPQKQDKRQTSEALPARVSEQKESDLGQSTSSGQPDVVDNTSVTGGLVPAETNAEVVNGVAEQETLSENVPRQDLSSAPNGLASVALAEERGSEAGMDSDDFREVTPTPSQTRELPTQRALPTLPPPFYPSQAPSDPTPSTSNSVLPAQQAFDAPPKHHLQGLVFGGHRDSSNASPAPLPPHHSHNAQPTTPSFSGPVPTSSTFVSSGHSYHYSEPQPHFQPAFAYGPPHHFAPQQQQPRSFQPPHGRQPPYTRRPQDYNFTPRYQQGPYPPPVQHYSGTFGPANPRPVNQPDDGPKAIHPDMMRDYGNQSQQMRHPSVSQSEGYTPFEPRGPAVPEDPTAIARYLTSHFSNPEYADIVMHLSHTAYKFLPTSLPAHRLILARSPKLRSLMSMPADEPQNGLISLSAPISDRFLNLDNAIIRGIMRLYGEALPGSDEVRHLSEALVRRDGCHPDNAQMCFSLALAASGHFLQIDEIISHGLLLAGRLLNWTTLPQALAFALEGGLSMAFANIDTSSKEESSVSSSGTPTKFDSPSSAPAYGFYSDRLLNLILIYIVHNMPPSILFSTAAPQLVDPPRLPIEAEPKHSRTPSSRLSQIRFGEMALEDPSNADPLTTAISSILLSLPFPLLLHLSESSQLGERLTWSRMAGLMKAVVQERELRRQRAMSQKPANADEHGLWRAVRMREVVEASDRLPSGIKLVRRPDGADTPPSTASDKD